MYCRSVERTEDHEREDERREGGRRDEHPVEAGSRVIERLLAALLQRLGGEGTARAAVAAAVAGLADAGVLECARDRSARESRRKRR